MEAYWNPVIFHISLLIFAGIINGIFWGSVLARRDKNATLPPLPSARTLVAVSPSGGETLCFSSVIKVCLGVARCGLQDGGVSD